VRVRGSAVVWRTALKAERTRFRIPIESLGFFTSFGLGSASNRNEYQRYSLGGKCGWSFIMSVHMYKRGYQTTAFRYRGFLLKFVNKIQIWLQSDKNVGHFLWKPQYIYIVDSSAKYLVEGATVSCYTYTASKGIHTDPEGSRKLRLIGILTIGKQSIPEPQCGQKD
jgi:hypothetical protein